MSFIKQIKYVIKIYFVNKYTIAAEKNSKTGVSMCGGDFYSHWYLIKQWNKALAAKSIRS